MSKEIVQANYEQLAELATRFQQQADRVQQMTQRVHRNVGALQGGGWQGKGVQAFSREMEGEVLPAVRRLEGALAEAGRVTLNISAVLRQAEEEAALPFRGDGASANPTPGSPGSVEAGSPSPASLDQILNRGSQNASRVFSQDYMRSMIGRVETGANNPQLNTAMEQLLDRVRRGDRDLASVGPLLDNIARMRGVDPGEFRQQYQNVFLPLWDNSTSKGTIDLNRHGDYMGSTISLRYGRVVGDVMGMDPVFGAVLNPTGGLVGPGDTSYQPGTNDAIGYHGVFHDAGGYLYNYQGRVGPGYDYMGREPFPTSFSLAGQIGGISWWSGHPQLDVDVLPYVMPDLPYVPRFVETGFANLIENKSIATIRAGVFIYEGANNLAEGVNHLMQGNYTNATQNLSTSLGQFVASGTEAIWATVL
jgi:WXG100 family type VII secretion target